MILILLGVLLVLIYWCNYRLNYWNRQNVPSVPTSVYSAIGSLFYFPTPLIDHYANVHKQLKHHFGGSFWLFQPQLVVRDPELIKQILVKDFEYFRDRGNVLFDKYDPLTHHIFNSPGDLWREIWTPEQMTSQCLLFFIAGYDTSSLVLSMTLLELAMNLDIQKTLHEEIDSFASQNDNKITYEMLKSMPYLGKIVKETLRKYPVLPIISRICVKPYNIPNTDIIIEKGTEVLISLAGLHKDPAIYPNPEVFDPERFSDEETQKRHKYAYLPFGEGPRNCIGSRFGLMTVKLGIVHILQKFNLEKTPQTVYPMMFQPTKFVTDCGAPLFLRCVPRK